MGTITEPRPFAPIPTLDDLMKDNPKLRKEDIDYLQSWMSKQPHLPKIPDELLASFLHTNYYSLEQAKNTIENHFTIRTHAPELFTDRDILAPEAQKQLPLIQGGKFRKKDPEGNLVWAIRLMPGDASKVDFDVCFKLGLMILDQTIREDPTCSGYVLIADAKGATMAHVAVLKLVTIKRFLKYVQRPELAEDWHTSGYNTFCHITTEGLNVRLKAVHVINVSPVVDYVLQLFKPFFNKELMDKIQVHPGPVSELYKVVPQSILPNDYGGDLEDMTEVFNPTVRMEQDNQQTVRVDEEKKAIYHPCIPHFSERYNLNTKAWVVKGLLFGARGTAFRNVVATLKELGITENVVDDICEDILKDFLNFLHNHLYGTSLYHK